jgi:hypothetical protein
MLYFNSMRIFISYSSPDINIVSILADQLKMYGDIYYWDKDNTPGESAWEQIFSWIDNSDIVLVLITDATIARAMSVGQEIGKAKAGKKLIIPIVTSSVSKNDLGFLSDITYQEIDINNPAPAIYQIIELINCNNKEEFQKLSLVLVAIGFFIWLQNKK